MAAPPPPTPQQLAQMQQMQQQFAAEAARRGLTPQQFQEQQRQQLAVDAAKQGLSPDQFIAQLKARAIQQHQMQQQQQQGQAQGQGQQPQPQPQPQPQQQMQQIPVNPGVEAKPEALAVAKFLRSQDLKTRTCILDGQRKDMFKGIRNILYVLVLKLTLCKLVKRAFRALQSPAYIKARSKNPLLPEVTNDMQARNAVQLLPLSMLALRVSKVDPREGHNHAKPVKDAKRVKGLWTVKVERQQEFEPMMHYAWLYEGSQWKQKVWAGLALVTVMAVVLFPLWPLMLRQGVWYLSVGMMGLLGLFFAMAIFRLILFCFTIFLAPPGLWLFPNLFEDVGFFDSFKPVWGWQETKEVRIPRPHIGHC